MEIKHTLRKKKKNETANWRISLKITKRERENN